MKIGFLLLFLNMLSVCVVVCVRVDCRLSLALLRSSVILFDFFFAFFYVLNIF